MDTVDTTAQFTLTIWGMIAAFITAALTTFLAEPVKVYFQNKSRLRDLRFALYKELHYNYIMLDRIRKEKGTTTHTAFPFDEYVKRRIDGMVRDIKTGYYEQVLQNELILYYRLDESIIIHQLYEGLYFLKSYLTSLEPPLKLKYQNSGNIDILAEAATGYIAYYSIRYHSKDLDWKILKKIASKTDYKALTSGEVSAL